MKWFSRIFALLGFGFQYIIPIVLFGGVIPYTHEGIEAGLTGMGYIAIGVVVFIVTGKLKEHLQERPKSLFRGLLLSIFPIVWWIIISLALGWLGGFIASLTTYWDKILIFVIIGRIAYTAAEAFADAAEKKEDK